MKGTAVTAASRGTAPIVVMGPSGCGKSTLAHALARRLDRPFVEGDDHHPAQNIDRLASGVPLTEADRKPFLDSIGRALRDTAVPPVVSCSALRRTHRDLLLGYAPETLFVWIDVPAEELERRVCRRDNHFMPPGLLVDQLAVLEPPAPPEPFIRVDGCAPTRDQLSSVLTQLSDTALPRP